MVGAALPCEGLALLLGEPARRAGNWWWSQACDVGSLPFGVGVGPRAGTGVGAHCAVVCPGTR